MTGITYFCAQERHSECTSEICGCDCHIRDDVDDDRLRAAIHKAASGIHISPSLPRILAEIQQLDSRRQQCQNPRQGAKS